MAAFRILVLVALCVADVTMADDFAPSLGRVKRQVYGGYLGGNYGGYPYYGGASPYSSYNPGYGYPYPGVNYGDVSPYSYNSGSTYPYSGYNPGGGAYPYTTGYSGYPYNSGGYYGGSGQYY